MWRAFDETGRLAYPDFVETTCGIMPMYWVRVLGGGLYLAGRGARARGTCVMTWRRAPGDLRGARARGAAAQRSGASPVPTAPGVGGFRVIARRWHRRWEGMPLHVHRLGRRGGGRAPRCSRSCPMFLIRSNVPTIAAVKPYTPLELARPRRLRRRGLLQLPLADDPADPRGDGALRRVQQAGRVRLRPPVPVGLAPHRARPAAHRRQVPEPLARAPHGGPALDHAAVHHAGLPVAGEATASTSRPSSAAWPRR